AAARNGDDRRADCLDQVCVKRAPVGRISNQAPVRKGLGRCKKLGAVPKGGVAWKAWAALFQIRGVHEILPAIEPDLTDNLYVAGCDRGRVDVTDQVVPDFWLEM